MNVNQLEIGAWRQQLELKAIGTLVENTRSAIIQFSFFDGYLFEPGFLRFCNE